MTSRLDRIKKKANDFKEKWEIKLINVPDLAQYNSTCSLNGEVHKVSEYLQQQQLLDEKINSQKQYIESLSAEKEKHRVQLEELILESDHIKGQMKDDLMKHKDLSSEQNNQGLLKSQLSSKAQVSNLLALITNIDWSTASEDSKIEGFLFGKSPVKPFAFDFKLQKPEEIQETLWKMMDGDNEFAQLIGP